MTINLTNYFVDSYGNIGHLLFYRFTIDSVASAFDPTHSKVVNQNGKVYDVKTGNLLSSSTIGPIAQIAKFAGIPNQFLYFTDDWFYEGNVLFGTQNLYQITNPGYDPSGFNWRPYFSNNKFRIAIAQQISAGPHYSISTILENPQHHSASRGVFLNPGTNYVPVNIFPAAQSSQIVLPFNGYTGGQQIFATFGAYGLNLELDYTEVQSFNQQLLFDIGNSFYPYEWGGAGYGPQDVFMGYAGKNTKIGPYVLMCGIGGQTPPGNIYGGFDNGTQNSGAYPLLSSNTMIGIYSPFGEHLYIYPFVPFSMVNGSPNAPGTYNNFDDYCVDSNGVIWAITTTFSGAKFVVSSGDANKPGSIFAPPAPVKTNRLLKNFSRPVSVIGAFQT